MKTIVATYANRDTAEMVISHLEELGHKREDMGFAVAEHGKADNGAEAMVTVTVDERNLEMTLAEINRHDPLEVAEHEPQWKMNESSQEARNEHPDPNQFTAAPRKDQ
jgi:hypothetical protein